MSDGTAAPWGAIAAGLLPFFSTYLEPDEVDRNLALVAAARSHPVNAANSWEKSAVDYAEAHVLMAGGRFDDAMIACLRAHADVNADAYFATLCVGLLLVARHLAGQHARAAAAADEVLAEVPDLPGRYADLSISSSASVALAGAGGLVRSRHLVRVQLDVLARRYAHIHTAAGIPLVNAAVLLALDGQPERATVVLGAIGRHAMHMRWEGSFALFRAYSTRLHTELGDDVFLACLAESEALTVDDLLAIAHEVAAG